MWARDERMVPLLLIMVVAMVLVVLLPKYLLYHCSFFGDQVWGHSGVPSITFIWYVFIIILLTPRPAVLEAARKTTKRIPQNVAAQRGGKKGSSIRTALN